MRREKRVPILCNWPRTFVPKVTDAPFAQRCVLQQVLPQVLQLRLWSCAVRRGFGEVVQNWMSKQQWYSNRENVEVCFQVNFSIKLTYGNCVLQQKTGKIHFGCSQECCKRSETYVERGKKSRRREGFFCDS